MASILARSPLSVADRFFQIERENQRIKDGQDTLDFKSHLPGQDAKHLKREQQDLEKRRENCNQALEALQAESEPWAYASRLLGIEKTALQKAYKERYDSPYSYTLDVLLKKMDLTEKPLAEMRRCLNCFFGQIKLSQAGQNNAIQTMKIGQNWAGIVQINNEFIASTSEESTQEEALGTILSAALTTLPTHPIYFPYFLEPSSSLEISRTTENILEMERLWKICHYYQRIFPRVTKTQMEQKIELFITTVALAKLVVDYLEDELDFPVLFHFNGTQLDMNELKIIYLSPSEHKLDIRKHIKDYSTRVNI